MLRNISEQLQRINEQGKSIVKCWSLNPSRLFDAWLLRGTLTTKHSFFWPIVMEQGHWVYRWIMSGHTTYICRQRSKIMQRQHTVLQFATKLAQERDENLL